MLSSLLNQGMPLLIIFFMIIDSASQENFIDKDVNKLRLLIEKHLSCYNVGWIKTVDFIKVIERCKVPFFIGRYRYEVYYDTIDMDAYHMPLGRSW